MFAAGPSVLGARAMNATLPRSFHRLFCQVLAPAVIVGCGGSVASTPSRADAGASMRQHCLPPNLGEDGDGALTIGEVDRLENGDLAFGGDRRERHELLPGEPDTERREVFRTGSLVGKKFQVHVVGDLCSFVSRKAS
jgi:hypothetical protein